MRTDQLLNYKFIKDIMYYDGPIISLGLTQEDTPVLEIWCDTNREEKYHIYAYAFIKKEDFQPFVYAKKSFFNVLKDAEEIITFKYNGEAFDFSIMANSDFLAEYVPKENSDLDRDLIDFRVALADFYNKEQS